MLALQTMAAAYGVFFLVAGLGKLDSWSAWKRTLTRFIPLGGRPGFVLRLGVPAMEIGTALLLLGSPQLGLVWSGLLLVVLGLTAMSLNSRHQGEECSCFGALMRSQIGWKLILRNFCLAGISFGVAYQARHVEVPGLTGFQVTLGLLVGLLVLTAAEWRNLRQIQISGLR